MSFTMNLVLGLIKGMGGPDLQKIIDKLPEEIGTDIGTILKSYISNSSNNYSRLVDWINNNRNQSDILLKSVYDVSISNAKNLENSNYNTTVLDDYLTVINLVIRTIIEDIKRPIVLQGFFHKENCLSYWHFVDLSNIAPISYDPKHNFIKLPSWPRIYILNKKINEDNISKLNTKIRKNSSDRLDPADYLKSKYVSLIREFDLELGASLNTVKIPDGAPAIISMVNSLELAKNAHFGPSSQLKNTLNKI
ncbi:MAG: hypothetical protein ACT6FE_08370 [Methanosarcinaceae archaeon]